MTYHQNVCKFNKFKVEKISVQNFISVALGGVKFTSVSSQIGCQNTLPNKNKKLNQTKLFYGKSGLSYHTLLLRLAYFILYRVWHTSLLCLVHFTVVCCLIASDHVVNTQDYTILTNSSENSTRALTIWQIAVNSMIPSSTEFINRRRQSELQKHLLRKS